MSNVSNYRSPTSWWLCQTKVSNTRLTQNRATIADSDKVTKYYCSKSTNNDTKVSLPGKTIDSPTSILCIDITSISAVSTLNDTHRHCCFRIVVDIT